MNNEYLIISLIFVWRSSEIGVLMVGVI